MFVGEDVKSDRVWAQQKKTQKQQKNCPWKKNLGIGGRLKVSMRNIEKLKRDEKKEKTWTYDNHLVHFTSSICIPIHMDNYISRESQPEKKVPLFA